MTTAAISDLPRRRAVGHYYDAKVRAGSAMKVVELDARTLPEAINECITLFPGVTFTYIPKED